MSHNQNACDVCETAKGYKRFIDAVRNAAVMLATIQLPDCVENYTVIL